MMNKRLRFYVRIIPHERDGRECLETDGDKGCGGGRESEAVHQGHPPSHAYHSTGSSIRHHRGFEFCYVDRRLIEPALPLFLSLDHHHRPLQVLWIINEKYTGMKKLPRLKFETDGIFTDACQAFIYETIIGQDLFSLTTKMDDVVVMAFGQSGTGKSYTMTGIRDHYHFRGVIPRIFGTIFELRKKKDFTLKMSALEFIHGKCRDLLAQSTPEVDCRKVTGVRLNDEYEANDLLFKAESNRCRISNGNCGTMVVTLFLKPAQHGVRNPALQKIHFVDPAGTEVHWSRLRESPCLTKTTGWLKEIYVSDPSNDWAFLTERSIKGRLDPRQAYRNSTLVGYLCDSLRTGSIKLIGHIRRSSEDLRYSLATLRYGCGLTGRPENLSNTFTEAEVNITDQSLQREVQQLRDELAITDLLESNFVPLTAVTDSVEALNAEVENYLTSPETESCANLLTMAHPFTLLEACRAVYKKGLERLRSLYDLEGGLGEKGSMVTGITTTSIGSKKSRKKSVQHGEIHEQMFAKLADQLVAPSPSRLDQTASKAEVTRQSMVMSGIMESGKNNRNPLWKEFLSRYPHWHMKLAATGEDLRQAREERDKVEEHVKELISRMQQNKFDVDRTTWERNNEIGNPVRPDGQLILSEEEQAAQTERTALLQAHKTAMETFKQVHDYYTQVAERFNKAHEGANQLFTEYVNTTYGNTLVLPATEDYEETVPILGVDYSIKPSSTKSEEDFIQLQNKHLNKDRRDPPHPRWP